MIMLPGRDVVTKMQPDYGWLQWTLWPDGGDSRILWGMSRIISTLMMAAVVSPFTMIGPLDEPTHTAAPEYTADANLKFPEHYREWIFLSSGVGMTYGPMAAMNHPMAPTFDNVFVNPEAYRAFLETGHWPDKTVFVLEVRASESHASINKEGHFQRDVVGIEAEVKDESLPAGKWSFYGFGVEPGKQPVSGRPLPRTASCYSCHAKNTAVENTFVQFYPALYEVAEAKGTLNPGFERLPLTGKGLFEVIRAHVDGAVGRRRLRIWRRNPPMPG